MSEHIEINRLNKYIEDLKKQVNGLRKNAEDYELQAEYLEKQKELFEKYGAKIPIAMQTTQYMVEQIADYHSSSTASQEPPKTVRYSTPRGHRASQGKYYNIAPLVKPIMNGIFGRGKEDVPEDFDSLFNTMYGQDWTSRIIRIPLRPGSTPMTRIYLEDLHSGDSYIRVLINGADQVINRKMRGNTPPFIFREKAAAVELVQLYNKINSIGWDIYDKFMIRNGIRQPSTD